MRGGQASRRAAQKCNIYIVFDQIRSAQRVMEEARAGAGCDISTALQFAASTNKARCTRIRRTGRWTRTDVGPFSRPGSRWAGGVPLKPGDAAPYPATEVKPAGRITVP